MDEVTEYELMLKNNPWLSKFASAIQTNPNKFKEKVVLNLKAGSGWLAVLCVKAGASKVFAVEPTTSLIPMLKATIDENNCTSHIMINHCDVEDLKLKDKVDIIISEWIFFDLIEDTILNKVLLAKEFLKTDGIVIPESCEIFLALCELPEYFQFWKNVQGIKMETIGECFRQNFKDRPYDVVFNQKCIHSQPNCIAKIDFKTMTEETLQFINKTCICVSSKECKIDGLCIWTNVSLFESEISFSQFKFHKENKQTVIVFPTCLEIEENEPVCFTLSMQKQHETYSLSLEMLEANDVSHPIGCPCFLTKCVVIKACLENPAFQMS